MDITSCPSASASTSNLKREASEALEADEGRTRKRYKEDRNVDNQMDTDEEPSKDSRVANALAQELQCGCCSEIVYRPVLVMPCQHFFCGRSVSLKNKLLRGI